RPTLMAAVFETAKASWSRCERDSAYAKRGAKLHFCYEAGPTGYELYRQLIEMGHDCVVVAPALIPKRPGDRVKTNRRDAVSLARLHRAGELTPVWVPDRGHEAMRDLVRARDAAQEAQKRARQQLQSFLLRHGRIYPGRTVWSQAHMRWMSTLKFEHPAHFIVLKEYCQAIEDAEVRLRRLTDLITETVKSWTMGPVVHAYQALRGVSVMAVVVFLVEIGDIRRFENPRQLMAFLGLVPSESSTGEHVKRGGITKAGNGRARRVLIEGAWTYRFPARVSRTKQRQLTGLPRAIREIAWKGQVRLCARYRAMLAAGKHKAVTITAIAREMGAFLWAIGQEVQPAAQA
ncbi:IS110 family transposase, partial [Rhizobium leguminosarum]|uniref:IS110 family transposase n=1 Tax=Rhizobium leguminosarum TaxID=384 RepID=UPI003D026BC3